MEKEESDKLYDDSDEEKIILSVSVEKITEWCTREAIGIPFLSVN